MDVATKKCPMCAEEILLAAVTCEYCGVRFEVTSTGYCQNCHAVREAEGNGQCWVCGKVVVDLRVESRLVEEPVQESLPVSQTNVQPESQKIRKSRLSIGILTGILVLAVIGILVWFGRNSLLATPAPTPTLTDTATHTLAHTLTSTLTLTPTQTPHPTPTRTLIPPRSPAWVKNFSEPILAAIKDQPPRFEDDFSVSYGKGWYDRNQEHISFTVEGGVLRITEEKSYNCGANNKQLNRSNFVLQIDFLDHGSLKFHGTDQDFFGHGLSVDQNANVLWWNFGVWDARMNGSITISSGSRLIQTIIIKRGSKAAFYLNGIPQAYLDDPVLSGPINQVILLCGEYDNVKFWDLDNIPNLP